VPLSNKSIEALDQAEGPFVRLVDLAATLFDCQFAALTLLTPTEALVRVSGQAQALRIPRDQSIAIRLKDMEPGAVLIVPNLRDVEGLKDLIWVRCDGGEACFEQSQGLAATMLRAPDGSPVGALILIFGEGYGGLEPSRVEALKTMAQMADDILAGVEAARIRDEQISSLELVGQMAGVGHWRVERDTELKDWSEAVYSFYGLDKSQIIPNLDNSWRFQDPAGKVALKQLMQRAFDTGEGYVTTLQLKNNKGEIRRVETRANTERDEKGRVSALFGVFQDMTEHDRLLETAQRNESRYRLLAENVGDALTRVRTDGSSKYISPAIQNIIGWTYEEMSGQVLDYVYADDRATVLDCIREAVRTGEPVMREFRAVHRCGHTVWVECTFKAVQGESAPADDVIVVIRDASRRKALEEEVIEAKDRAEQAAAAKSEFLANMSHELRTPLTSVIGFSGLLSKSKVLPDEERLYVERISTASEALLEVINDILDYSKLEADAIELDPATFDPRALIEGTAAIVETLCRDKGLRLEVHCDNILPKALIGDVGRLRQVMLNFLSNAVKFTARGAVTVRACGRAQADGCWKLRFEVQDSGIGIASEKLPHLFDRFTQADASTTRLYGGTGLGLAISHRLIQLMQGQIGVRSVPGQGSSFWFEVPLELGQRQPVVATEGRFEGAEALGWARLLMADDAPANRELMTAILGGLGLELVTVQDGAEAVQAMQEGRFDLVLMDVHMPVMDGLEATREIRRMEAQGSRRTPILALTANVQAEQMARCVQAGMDGHLAKPIQLPQMVAALSQWLTEGGLDRVGSGGR